MANKFMYLALDICPIIMDLKDLTVCVAKNMSCEPTKYGHVILCKADFSLGS